MGMVKYLICLFVVGLLNLKQVNYEHFKHATVTTNNSIVKVYQILQKDASYTVRQFARMRNLSLTHVEKEIQLSQNEKQTPEKMYQNIY
jgi:hypothetical protein